MGLQYGCWESNSGPFVRAANAVNHLNHLSVITKNRVSLSHPKISQAFVMSHFMPTQLSNFCP